MPRSIRLVFAVLLMLHGVSPWILSTTWRQNWWWFASPRGTEPWEVQTFLCFLGGALILSDAYRHIPSLLEFPANQLKKSWASHALVTSLLSVAVFFAVFWIGRSNHVEWGDGPLAATRYSFDTSLWSFYAPITTWIKSLFASTATQWLGFDSFQRQQLESVFIGSCTGMGLLWLCLRLWGTSEGLLWWLLCCCSNSVLLWFGHVEIYTLSWGLGLFAILLAIAYLENRIPLWPGCLAFSFAAGAAVWYVLYFPAIAWLLWIEWHKNSRKVWQWLGILAAFIAPAVAITFILSMEDILIIVWQRAAWLGQGDTVGIDEIPRFSAKHILGILQVLLMAGTPCVFALVLWRNNFSITDNNGDAASTSIRQSSSGSPTKNRDANIFMALLLGVTVLFTLLWQPALGLPWDWDLYTFAGPPLALGTAWLAVYKRESLERRRELGAIALASFCIVIPWLLGNSQLAERIYPAYGRYRIEYLLNRDPVSAYRIAVAMPDQQTSGYRIGPHRELHSQDKSINFLDCYLGEDGFRHIQLTESAGGTPARIITDAALTPPDSDTGKQHLLRIDRWGRIWNWRDGHTKQVDEPDILDGRASGLAIGFRNHAIRLWEDGRIDHLRLSGLDSESPACEKISEITLPGINFLTYPDKSLPHAKGNRAIDIDFVIDPSIPGDPGQFLVLFENGTIYDVASKQPLMPIKTNSPPLRLVGGRGYFGILYANSQVQWLFDREPPVVSEWPVWWYPSLRDITLVRGGHGALLLDHYGGIHEVGDVPLMQRWYPFVATINFGFLRCPKDHSVYYLSDTDGRVRELFPDPQRMDKEKRPDGSLPGA